LFSNPIGLIEKHGIDCTLVSKGYEEYDPQTQTYVGDPDVTTVVKGLFSTYTDESDVNIENGSTKVFLNAVINVVKGDTINGIEIVRVITKKYQNDIGYFEVALNDKA
jgi:hypothetical protein